MTRLNIFTFLIGTMDAVLLLPDIGLLLDEIPRSFIKTGSISRNLLFYDMLGDIDDPENKCTNQQESRINSAQSTFFSRATTQLTRNGYVYDTDKESIRVPQADDPLIASDLPLLISSHCSCTNMTCSCSSPPNTTVEFTCPEPLTGHLNISLDLGDDHLLNRDIFSMSAQEHFALLTTKMSTYRFRLHSNDQLRIASISQENHIATITIIALNLYSFEVTSFSCSTIDARCSSDPITTTVTVAKTEEQPQRSRRSWFFDLTTDREVSAKINSALRVTSQYLSKDILERMSKELRSSDAAISQTNSELSTLFDELCTTDYLTRKRITELEAVINIQRSIDRLLEALRECSLGTIPHSTEHATIMSFCYASIPQPICDNLSHSIATLMTCSIKRISILRNKYAVELSISVPESLVSNYTLYRLATIPVYDAAHDVYRHLVNLDGTTLAHLKNRDESILLTDCTMKNRMHICTSHADHTRQDPECITHLVSNSTRSCRTTTVTENVNCIAKDLESGILLSTRQPVLIHKHGLKQTFSAYSGTATGVTFLQNNPETSVSVECAGLIHSTILQIEGTVDVLHHDAFNWSVMTTHTNPELERRISETRKEIDQHIAHLNGSFITSLSSYSPDWLPEDSNSRRLVLILIIIIVICFFIFLAIIRFYCKQTTMSYSPANLLRLANLRQ